MVYAGEGCAVAPMRMKPQKAENQPGLLAAEPSLPAMWSPGKKCDGHWPGAICLVSGCGTLRNGQLLRLRCQKR